MDKFQDSKLNPSINLIYNYNWMNLVRLSQVIFFQILKGIAAYAPTCSRELVSLPLPAVETTKPPSFPRHNVIWS